MFTTKNMRFPNFSLPKPIINYFMVTVKGNTMKKLHKSCKYFYFKNKFTILDYFGTCDLYEKRELEPYGIGFNSNETDLTFIKDNIWLISSLMICDFPKPSNIISKIVHCEIRSLTIDADNVTMKEIKFLTKSGNVENLTMDKQIFYSNGAKVPPEDLIALLPKAYFILLNTYTFNEETMKNLIKMKRLKKIHYLLWYKIEQEINVNLLCQFLEKHHVHGGRFSAWFKDLEYNERFAEEICEKMREWEPKDRLPWNFPVIHLPI